MRAARLFAFTVLALVIGWSLWFAIARAIPEVCQYDGCVRLERDNPALRWIAWTVAVAFGVAAAAMTRSSVGATSSRIASTATVAAIAFVVVLITLGEPFPPTAPDVGTE